MTPEQENIKELVSRYKAWLSQGVYNSTYYKSKFEWVESVKSKVRELELKLKTITIKEQ